MTSNSHFLVDYTSEKDSMIYKFHHIFEKHNPLRDAMRSTWRTIHTSGQIQCDKLSLEVRNWNNEYPNYQILYNSHLHDGIIYCSAQNNNE